VVILTEIFSVVWILQGDSQIFSVVWILQDDSQTFSVMWILQGDSQILSVVCVLQGDSQIFSVVWLLEGDSHIQNGSRTPKVRRHMRPPPNLSCRWPTAPKFLYLPKGHIKKYILILNGGDNIYTQKMPM
jgi:hypothetical protein